MSQKPSLDINGALGDPFEEGRLTRKELESLPPQKLAEVIMWQRQVVDDLNDRLTATEASHNHLRTLVNRISVDAKTGILTMSALNALADILFDSQVMQILKERGYTLKLCFLDVDELKKHNSLGGHDAGDTVLAEVAKRLKILYRRKSDVVACGMLDFLSMASQALREDGTLAGAGRYERGDEMVAWRYSPPKESDVRRRGWSPKREVSRIKKGFDGASVSYSALNDLTKQDIGRIDPEGRFKIKSGIVTAPISITFACVNAPMPTSRHEARRIMRAAGQVAMSLKLKRGSTYKFSEGVSLTLTSDDLI